jgi:hypothetical protein
VLSASQPSPYGLIVMGPVAIAIVTGSSSIPLTTAVYAVLRRYRRVCKLVNVDFGLTIKVGKVYINIRVTDKSPDSPPEKFSGEKHGK